MSDGSQSVLERARAIKRQNAATAALSGSLLAVLGTYISAPGPLGWAAGLVAGVIYANAFEYVLHRFILHAPSGYLAKTHGVHHQTWRAEDEPLYVNFAHSPWVVVLLFVGNAVPAAALQAMLGAAIAPGMLVAFALYFVVLEEIHWRSHLVGTPRWLDPCRRHHLRHHVGARNAFNVFFPLCDWIFGGR